MLNQRWSRVLVEIMKLFRDLDDEVAVFAAKSDMHCPPGCGACCLSPHVETTVAELLPLAHHLFATHQIDITLERLQRGGSLCVQYEADPLRPHRGRCRTYAQRPSLCRLFGYSGARDKNGQLRYAACTVLRHTAIESIQAVDSALNQHELSIPMLGPAHERVSEIDGHLGVEIMPINQALQRAIEVIGLDLHFAECQLAP